MNKSMLVMSVIGLLVVSRPASARNWDYDHEHGAYWSHNCDFRGRDLHCIVDIPTEMCSVMCLNNPECTHFTWWQHWQE